MILEQINNIPNGYSKVLYNSKKYGLRKEAFNNQKSFKIYAEELGGTDFISLNYYITTNKELLRPCEMPEQKVLDFLKDFKLIN